MLVAFYWISFPTLGLCIACALYGGPREWFAGSGKRRFTRASAAVLTEEIGTLSMQLAEAKRVKACESCGHLSGWPTGAELAVSDRSDPAPHISAKAPVDNGSRDTPLAAAATVRDASLASMALPGEEEMAAELDELRRSNAVTTVLPVVPNQPPATNPLTAAVEARLNITGPIPGRTATSVPVGTGDRAHAKVSTALSESS